MSNVEIFNTAKYEYEHALKKMGGKLILNTSKLNGRNKKIDLEVLFSLIPHLTKQYPEILPNYFFNSLLDIFRSFIDYTKISAETQ